MRGLSFNLLGALLLSACATTPTPAIKTEFIDRPVVQLKSCITPKEVPQRPGALSESPAPTNLERAFSEALAKVSEWTRYGKKADIIMNGCAQ